MAPMSAARHRQLLRAEPHQMTTRKPDMTLSRNAIILALAAAVSILGYLYYQSRQNVVEIKLPSVTISKQP
jgi:hypothetical protein